MNLDLVIDIAFKLTLSTLALTRSVWHFLLITNISATSSRLKCLRFSSLDSICLSEAKILCLVLITFVYTFQF